MSKKQFNYSFLVVLLVFLGFFSYFQVWASSSGGWIDGTAQNPGGAYIGFCAEASYQSGCPSVRFQAGASLTDGWVAFIWTPKGPSSEDSTGSYEMFTNLTNAEGGIDGTLVTHSPDLCGGVWCGRIDYGPDSVGIVNSCQISAVTPSGGASPSTYTITGTWFVPGWGVPPSFDSFTTNNVAAGRAGQTESVLLNFPGDPSLYCSVIMCAAFPSTCSATQTYTSAGPTVDLDANSSDGPITIAFGSAATLTWATTDASSCNGSNTGGSGWSGPMVFNNSAGVSTGILTQNVTFTLDCMDGSGNPGQDMVTVNVTSPPPPPAPTGLNASCNVAGDQVTLSWNPLAEATAGYLLRVNFLANDSGACLDGWYCTDPPDKFKDYYIPTSYTLPVTPGASYNWWVHGVNDGGVGPPQSASFVCVAVNNPPSASLVTVTEPIYCVSGPGASITWTYTDPESSPQSGYQVQIDNNSSFSSPEWDSGVVSQSIPSGSTAGSHNTASFGVCSVSNPGGTGAGTCRLTWNTNYWARVRVWDSSGAVSPWVEATACSGPGCQ